MIAPSGYHTRTCPPAPKRAGPARNEPRTVGTPSQFRFFLIPENDPETYHESCFIPGIDARHVGIAPGSAIASEMEQASSLTARAAQAHTGAGAGTGAGDRGHRENPAQSPPPAYFFFRFFFRGRRPRLFAFAALRKSMPFAFAALRKSTAFRFCGFAQKHVFTLLRLRKSAVSCARARSARRARSSGPPHPQPDRRRSRGATPRRRPHPRPSPCRGSPRPSWHAGPGWPEPPPCGPPALRVRSTP